jgi:hypothetical protein
MASAIACLQIKCKIEGINEYVVGTHHVSHSKNLQALYIQVQKDLAADKSQALYHVWYALLWRPY